MLGEKSIQRKVKKKNPVLPSRIVLHKSRIVHENVNLYAKLSGIDIETF
jgi:hypothetical protein